MSNEVKKMLVLVAGVDTLRRYDVDRRVELPQGETVVLQLRTYRDLAEVPSLLRMERHKDTELVHVANDLKIGHVELSRICSDMARAISAHPNQPWVTLDEASLNWVRTTFVRYRIKVFAGRPQEALRDRWRRFAKERVKIHAS